MCVAVAVAAAATAFARLLRRLPSIGSRPTRRAARLAYCRRRRSRRRHMH